MPAIEIRGPVGQIQSIASEDSMEGAQVLWTLFLAIVGIFALGTILSEIGRAHV